MKRRIREIIQSVINEAKIPNNEIPEHENLNSGVKAICDLINLCDSCGCIHPDGTRNNCV